MSARPMNDDDIHRFLALMPEEGSDFKRDLYVAVARPRSMARRIVCAAFAVGQDSVRVGYTGADIITRIERISDAAETTQAASDAPQHVRRRSAGHVHEGVVHLAAALRAFREAWEVDRG